MNVKVSSTAARMRADSLLDRLNVLINSILVIKTITKKADCEQKRMNIGSDNEIFSVFLYFRSNMAILHI